MNALYGASKKHIDAKGCARVLYPVVALYRAGRLLKEPEKGFGVSAWTMRGYQAGQS